MVIPRQPDRLVVDGGHVSLAHVAGIAGRRPSWWTDAACRGVGSAAFFLDRGGDTRPALALCAGCPVIAECAAAGAAEEFGIWAGTTPTERKAIAKARRTGEVAQ
jgi:hypothetical protein